MNQVMKNIAELKEAEYNPRKISDKKLEELKVSLKEFGIVQPLIVNTFKGRENIVVGGHQRLKALKQLGYTEVPCVLVELSLQQEKELNIRLNKSGGEFDKDEWVSYYCERGMDFETAEHMVENSIDLTLVELG